MKRICAWCQKDLDPAIDGKEEKNAPITHGICGDCVRKAFAYKSKPLRTHLDAFDRPVFLMTPQVRVQAANSAALKLLNKEPDELTEKLAGDVFDCKHASTPEGCGNTVHCKSCTIRRTIEDTIERGKSHTGVPAYPDLHYITGENKVRFLISTERVGEAVLLRIDEVTEERSS